jgi:hypothetical protein
MRLLVILNTRVFFPAIGHNTKSVEELQVTDPLHFRADHRIKRAPFFHVQILFVSMKRAFDDRFAFVCAALLTAAVLRRRRR